MFCPDCGRDCGEDEFCVACGTDGEEWDAESINGEMTEGEDQQEEFIRSVYAMIQDNRKGRLLIKAEVEERNPGLACILRERLEQQTDMDRYFVDEAERAQIPLEKRRGSDPASYRPLCCPRCLSEKYRTVRDPDAVMRRILLNQSARTRFINIALRLNEMNRDEEIYVCENCGYEWEEHAGCMYPHEDPNQVLTEDLGAGAIEDDDLILEEAKLLSLRRKEERRSLQEEIERRGRGSHRSLTCPRCCSAHCIRTIETAELYRYPSGYKMLAWLMKLAIWKVRGRTRCLCEVCGLEWYE